MKEWLYETGIHVYRLVRTVQHKVPGIEIVFILSGNTMIETGSLSYRFSEADILLITKCEHVRFIPILSEHENECLLFTLQIAQEYLHFAFGDNVPSFACNSIIGKQDFSNLRSILAEIIYKNLSTTTEKDKILFNFQLFRLFIELHKNFLETEEKPLADENEENKRKKALVDYIKKNFRYPISLEETAEHFSLTTQYFSRYFRKQFGINFHAYIKDYRLEGARKDLVLSDETVTAIAYDNGFPNLNSFLKALADATGQTPTEYRKNYRIINHASETSNYNNQNTEELTLLHKKLQIYIKNTDEIQQKEKLTITVNVLNGTIYKRPWEDVINLGFARDFLKTAFYDQINLIQKEMPFKYGRFQGLFEKSSFSTKESKQEYNFIQIERIIDFLYSVKLIPFIELGYKPHMIHGRHGEFVFFEDDGMKEMSVNEYEKFINKFIKHVTNRYGVQEVNKWCFEMMAPTGVWNDFHYTNAEIENYLEQFMKIRKVIKETAPIAKVGGPGFNLSVPEDLDMMVKFLDRLQEHNSSPDFFSFYAFSFSEIYSGFSPAKGGKLVLWSKEENSNRIAWAKKFIQSQNLSINNFFVTEWSLDFSCRNRLHDSLFNAAFILQNNIDAIGTVDVLAHWIASDLSAEYSDTNAILFGGAGLISRHGIRKPAFFAYNFLSRLGCSLLSKGKCYIVTERSENDYVAIIFNYKYISEQSRLRNDYQDLAQNQEEFLENKDKLAVSLHLTNTYHGTYKMCSHILNTHNGSIFDAWKRLCTVEDLSTSEASWLERTCIPDLQINILYENEDIIVECELEPNEIRLMEISLIRE
jgi:beta-xylosidase/AraC-like DNA-binding protein